MFRKTEQSLPNLCLFFFLILHLVIINSFSSNYKFLLYISGFMVIESRYTYI